MKKVIHGLMFLVFSISSFAQCGIFQSYIVLTEDNGPSLDYAGGINAENANLVFPNYDFESPSSLYLKGAKLKTWQTNGGSCNVDSGELSYKVYKSNTDPSSVAFQNIALSLDETIPSGTSLDKIFQDTSQNIDLMALMTTPGNWKIEVYWRGIVDFGNGGNDLFDSNFGNNHIAQLDIVILPVDLTSFSARIKTNSVNIDWTTATESNSDYFNVERSFDGSEFEVLGQKKAQGNSMENVNYSFLDESPINGINYYRLRQVDIDGSFRFSEIIPIEYSTGNNQFDIYPVPANGEISFASKIPCKLIIYNPSGQIVYDQTCNAGENSIDLYSLTSGLYFYTVYKATDFSEIGKGKIILE